MRHRKRLRSTAIGVLAVLAVFTAACGSDDDGGAADVESSDTTAAAGAEESDTTAAAGETAATGGTLIVGKSFDLKTLDPGRQFETTGAIIVPAIYDTLLTFVDNDVTTPVPSLAESWEVNDDATEFTLTLRADATFSDGSPVTAQDAAFSLNRVRELKGNGSFLMDGVTAEAVDDATLKLTSEKPNPALPRILPTPTLGILNSEVVHRQRRERRCRCGLVRHCRGVAEHGVGRFRSVPARELQRHRRDDHRRQPRLLG